MNMSRLSLHTDDEKIKELKTLAAKITLSDIKSLDAEETVPYETAVRQNAIRNHNRQITMFSQKFMALLQK